MKKKAISLFSGAGGFDLGFEAEGFDIVFANEMNSDACSTWIRNRENKKNVMNKGDICDLGNNLKLDYEIDLVFGGPPCQGFSVAGKMQQDDKRNELVFSFMDMVSKVKPKAFVMENVGALATHAKWGEIRKALTDRASQLGYATSLNVFLMSNYGVPQNRKRMLFIGFLDGEKCVNNFISYIEQEKSQPKKLREVLTSVGEYGSPSNPETCFAKITIAKNPVIRGSAYSGMLMNGSGRPLDLDSHAPTITASMGGNRTPIVDQRALENPTNQNWCVSLYEGIVDPLKTPPKTVPGHVRRLTVKEAAAIQTFPADYVFVGSKCSQYRQIGNAVPPVFAQAVARSMIRCLNDKEGVSHEPEDIL